MYQESLQSLLSLEQAVQELTILVDRVQVLLARLDLSCQPLVAMVPTKVINTQVELVELELVEMLTCTVGVDLHMDKLMEQEDIHSLVVVLQEVIPVVETTLATICDVVHQVRVVLMDGSHPT
jgi:hypothetical protein